MVPAKFEIRERGPTPRGMKKRLNAHKKASWFEAALYYHQELRDKRFTHAHARRAGYTQRKPGYNRRKLRNPKIGHTRPLEFSGRTRSAIRRESRIANTSNGARVRYPGARVFNFRNPKSSVNMLIEFTTVLPDEAQQIADAFDQHLDRLLAADNIPND